MPEISIPEQIAVVWLGMAVNQWEAAGITDYQGLVGRPVPPGYVLVPGRVILDQRSENILWELSPSVAEEPRGVRPNKRLLDTFIKLWSKSAESILLFARRNGVLQIDESGCSVVPPLKGMEPISQWRRVSARAYAVISIAAALRDHSSEGIGDHQYWHALRPYWIPKDRSEARGYMTSEVNGWLKQGGVGIRMVQGKLDWQTEMNYENGLLGAIAAQIVLAVAGLDSYFFCSQCSLLYTRPRTKRRPKPGEMNFCDKCASGPRKAKVSLAAADKRRQEKVAEAKRLHAAGTPKKEIERLLNLKPGGATRLLAR